MTPVARSGPRFWAILGILAILETAWFAWFLLEPFPNFSGPERPDFCRLHLLVRAVPAVVPGVKLRETHLGNALEELSHVENLPGRVPILLAAAFIAASAVATGNLALRGLRLRPSLDSWERIAVGYGLGTIGLGLATLIVGRLGWLHPWGIRAGLVAPIAAELVARLREPRVPVSQTKPIRRSPWPAIGFVLVAGPFLLIMLLGSMLPSIDFDALEYHLQGPKEYYQAGRIAFLPHNVYTSMPFGVEMLHLLGMEVLDDWWSGALVGQVLVAAFAPATAVLIALTARRIGSPRAAWVAAVVYLTTPWVYRLAILPYVEGPLCFFHAGLIWAAFRGLGTEDSGLEDVGWVSGRETHQPNRPGRWVSLRSPTLQDLVLMGLLAGGAMAAKYTALVSAVVPSFVWAVWATWRSKNWRLVAGFVAGLALVIGPWLVKNVTDTGNPVYPLGYRVFGGRHWDPGRDAKWSAAHGPKPVEAAALVRSIVEIAGRSDWQSSLYVALVPLAFFCKTGRREIVFIAGYAAYLFWTWWLFTHRLDRFWLPILPALAILAGLGSDWVRSRAWTVLLSAILGLAIAMNAVYCSTALAGLTDWMGDLVTLRSEVPRVLNPSLYRLDRELPPGSRPLLVGAAAVFHLDRPIVYNTVFNDETIEAIAKGRTPERVGEELRRRGITHIYVDWSEIDRYRSPGNYGFTPFVTPEVFDRLVDAGVLKSARKMGLRRELFEVEPAVSRPR